MALKFNLELEDGTELHVGDKVTTFRGVQTVIEAIWQPNTSQGGRSGKVTLQGMLGLYNPQVIKANFIYNRESNVLPDIDNREIRGTRSYDRNMAREKGYDDE